MGYILLVIFLILIVWYILWLAGFLRGLDRLSTGHNEKQYRVSVIIPARNEGKNILAGLKSVLNQDYPLDQYEVIVVDDCSTDKTALLVEEMALRFRNVKILKIDKADGVISGKKQAITRGIQAANGEIILTIDADCTAQPGWITGLLRHFDEPVGVVAGATFFKPEDERTIFAKVQSLEVICLIAAGAGSMALGRPVICNGSNLAYRRLVFDQVQGFSGIDKLASGDDDMFIQKVRQQTKWQVVFCPEPATYNWTRPAATLREFFHQRIRWSSKGAHYPDKMFVAHLAATYACYVACLCALVLWAYHPAEYAWLPALLAAKFIMELLLLVRGCAIFKRKDLIKYFLWLGIPYMPYLVAVSTLGFFKKFNWKK